MPEKQSDHHAASWQRRFGLIAALALVALLGAEIALRAFPRYLPPEALFSLFREGVDEDLTSAVPDDYFGYLWEPNHEGRVDAPPFDFGFGFRTDEHGFRNPSPWPEQADIVVLGDSQAFAYGVDDDDAWPRVLADLVPGAEVVNLGLLGAAPQQAVRAYEVFGAPLRPKVVLVALYPPNALSSGRLFAEWIAEDRPEGFDVRRSGDPAEEAPEGAAGRLKHLLGQSYVVRALYHSIRHVTGVAAPVATMHFEEGRVRLRLDKNENHAAAIASGDTDFRRVLDLLTRLQGMVRGDGGEMVVVMFPTKQEIHLPLLARQAPDLVNPFLDAFERRDIPYIDLAPPLRDRVAAGEHLFFELDIHPNDEGYRVIAEILADRLKRYLSPRAA